MKNVAVFTEDGAFALFFSSPPRGIWQLKSPHPREFAIQGKKMLMTGGQPGGALGAAGIDWCITQNLKMLTKQQMSGSYKEGCYSLL